MHKTHTTFDSIAHKTYTNNNQMYLFSVGMIKVMRQNSY